ncbi:MAG: hypothetical protein WAW92_04625 [Minisyncoccia bacterium]
MFNESEFYDPNVSVEKRLEEPNEMLRTLAEERGQILQDILGDTERVNKLFYYVPGLNVGKFLTEAGFGETTMGEDLNILQRLAFATEAAALSYAIYVGTQEFSGEATSGMIMAATLGKLTSLFGHHLVMDKETVNSLLNYISDKIQDKTIITALLSSMAHLPENVFSDREVNLDTINA